MSTTRLPEGLLSSDEPEEMILSATSAELWPEAVHEAGHAVLARVTGYRVVVVEMREERLRCFARKDPGDYDVASDAIYTLGGEKAENAILGGWGETPLSESDRKCFASLGPGTPDSEERRVWRESVERKAEFYVQENLNAIERVARRLMNPPHQLSVAEVQEIVSASNCRQSL